MLSPRTHHWWKLHCAYPWNRLCAWAQGESSSRSIPLTWPDHPNRIDFLNQLVRRRPVTDYLEIGCREDRCFSRIEAPRKVGVDPVSGGTVRTTSDRFFAANSQRFDLIFIDGLHLAEQVLLDVRNALEVLKPEGIIILHDCLPLRAVAQYRTQSDIIWNGDVWKAFVEIRSWSHVDAATALLDHGLGIILPRPNSKPLPLPQRPLRFDQLASDYPSWLRTLPYPEAIRFALSASVPPTSDR